MRIFFVITGLGVGGAEKQVVDLADRLALLGHKVKIAYLTGPALMRPRCSEVEIVGLCVSKTVFDFFRVYLLLRKLIEKFDPDVVHAHMVHANILARLVRPTVKIPRLICTAHNTYEGGSMRMLAYRLTAELADVTSNVSVEAVAAFEKYGATKKGEMLVVYNGIDTNFFKSSELSRQKIRKSNGIGDDEKVLLAVGRLNVAKDYPNLFYAFAKLLQSKNHVRLWIVGDGELKPALMKLANDLGINELIHFWGVQNNIPEWLNAADIFVLPSAWEGFGLVVAEAMACQKVVVATDSGGVKEVMRDSGFIVPTRDSEALAGALDKALRLDVKQAHFLGERARGIILKNFSLDAAVEKWLNIYSGN